ncbi:poly-beta-hydroxybutyrate polymerase family protein [Burkholderia thailandensis MSMB121]|uniref:PHA/PHB synthase family protein n=1 Tax=Burkholderia humptydooensis TaxID=430531 RepID=UPI0003280C43|nr:alpha/beta fold hydrolase [Burkholderia humptydooensis]AGK49969.1 poly-beta-hydroxybutyrate polymerase family protein [Burkholderia thailandensis MSMB121]ATF33494.1 poly-beta-hydroxybutyrate polymerase [Burkholderia thailandensis]KST71567.1 poly-beta-hydroxybutyrate polymerase [Burkholderia humptydooensis]
MDTRHTPASGAPAAPLPAHPPASGEPENPYRIFDLAKEASLAKLTSGLSPASLQLALSDWLIHLAAAPGKRTELATLAVKHAALLAEYLFEAAAGHTPAPPAQPSPGDRRFRASAWQLEPYRFWHQSFLLAEQWWRAATHDVPGVSPHHEDVVAFSARQMLDMFAPANYVATNPEIAQRTALTGGANLAQGVRNYLDDVRRLLTKQPPAGAERFAVGKNLAITPGRVVFRNHLIELLQYGPTTADVYAEPVLIAPAWIMKYYILDLSAHNSLIRYLVGEGHTVFCISWRNVDASDRDLSLDDYRKLGVMDALDTIGEIVPGAKIHATGYCLGGTLLSIAAAAMANAGDERLASVTLLAAQTDFTEPGELQLFIDDSEIHFLESMMWERGFLGAHQMAGSFQLLMSNDLIWSRVIHDYLLGERTPMIDLMAWNADSTRMPYRMHSEYLRHLFLDNDLATNRYVIDGQTVSVHNVRAPFFVVGTEHDHIAPWRSVYKIHYLSGSDVTFVLTAGGHNAGIVSEPGHPKRHYRMKVTAADAPSVSPDEWLAGATDFEGSWWPAWHAWLARHSSAQRVAPPTLGKSGAHALGDAPGTYVFQK